MRRNQIDTTEVEVRPFAQEALLIDAIPRMAGDRILCTSAGLAQFAVAAAQAMPQAAVTCSYIDLYRANLAAEHVGARPANLTIECAGDFPEDEVDVVALPFSSGGEAELTRDLLQAAHQRLRIGGKVFASIENSKDKWLHEQVSKIFSKVQRDQSKAGVLYVGTKTEPLKKVKNFSCEFAFRDRGRLIRAFSQPGVFSHRHIDVGARRLMDAMQVEPGMRVLDIGCGAGVVALAAACCDPSVQVHAVDSNARAIECTERGAEMNEVANISTELNAAGGYEGGGTYDLALANPPYYASFRIAEHFLTAGREALRPGGKIVVVTKSPEWYTENFSQWYDDGAIVEEKGYYLVRGVRGD